MFLKKNKINRLNKGYTLLELLVALAIIGLLSSIILSSVNMARKKARDARRLSDMKQLQTALELYYSSYGRYPDGDHDGDGGWDTGGDGDFISALSAGGFLPRDILDPSINDIYGNYAYHRYTAGDWGCNASRGAFYVLGVRDMETSGRPYPTSPGFSCPPKRNWQDEYDWVTGSFEQ